MCLPLLWSFCLSQVSEAVETVKHIIGTSQAARLHSPVFTAIGLVNGKLWVPVIFDPTAQNRHTLTDR